MVGQRFRLSKDLFRPARLDLRDGKSRPGEKAGGGVHMKQTQPWLFFNDKLPAYVLSNNQVAASKMPALAVQMRSCLLCSSASSSPERAREKGNG